MHNQYKKLIAISIFALTTLNQCKTTYASSNPVVTVDDPIYQTETCDTIDEDDSYTWPGHAHNYTNTSGPTRGVEYWAYFSEFRILLDDDFMDYVDLDSMLCTTNVSGSYVNCDGGSYRQDSDTTVTVTLNESGQYIEWSWGSDSADWPSIAGDMYSDEERDGITYNQTVQKGIKFKFKEDAPSGISVTTNSEIYMVLYTWEDGHYYRSESDWGDWHWNTDSAPVSTTYTCEESLFCDDLTMTPTSITASQAEGTVTVTASSVDQNGHDWEDADEFSGYKYWATNAERDESSGTFRKNSSSTFPGDTGNPLITEEDNTVYYYNGEQGDTIYVCAVNSAGSCISACQAHVTSAIAPPLECTDLNLTPDSLTTDEATDTIDLIIDATASDGSNWADTDEFNGYMYWADSYVGDTALGEFYNTWASIFGSNPFTDWDETAYYKDGAAGDVIVACALDASGACIPECVDAVTSEAAPIECDHLTITAPTTYNSSTLSACFDIDISEFNTDGSVRNGIICYEATDFATGTRTTEGTFSDSTTTATGYLCTRRDVEYCNGNQGDVIDVYDQTFPAMCSDSLDHNFCGDAIVQSPNDDNQYEQCDDANDIDTDSCSNVCTTPTTPGDITPGDVTPGDVTPGDVTPGDVTPGDVTPGDVTPGDVTPGDITPGDITPIPPTNPGELEKKAKSYNFTIYGYETADSAVLAHDEDYLYYTLTYTAGSSEEVTITDTLSDQIDGSLNIGSTLNYDLGSFLIPGISECTPESIDVCYELANTSNPLAGITIRHLTEGYIVEMTYTARVASELKCEDPPQGVCLAESFKNEAQAHESDGYNLTAYTTATVICPYILTRNAGDVYLENQLDAGTNILCIGESEEFANSDGIVLVAKTLNDIPLTTILNSFSSYIKEMFYASQNTWIVANIIESAENHIARAMYNFNTASPVTGDMTATDWESLQLLQNTNNPDEEIYYFDGNNNTRNLTIGDGSDFIVPQGAHTIIIENADLYIHSNIKYIDADFGFNYYLYQEDADYTDLASLAIIVLNGDIYVSPNTRDISGVLYMDTGSMKSEDETPRDPIGDQLRIFGSVYGDMDPIIAKSGFVGPPELDHGSIVIRYDERVILNTPPAISEYIDVYSEKTAR